MEQPKAADIRGTAFAYVEQGEGTPVVFVHGSLSDWRQWQRQLGPFGRGHRAISYSRRGHTPNAPLEPGDDDGIAPNSEDLAEFLRTLGAVPAHLVGNSWGAFTSLYLAAKRPELVRSLVLEEPPVVSMAFDGPPGPETLQRLATKDPELAQAMGDLFQNLMGPVQELFKQNEDLAAMERFATYVLGGRKNYDALPAERKDQMRSNIAPLKASLLRPTAFTPFSVADARKVLAPTLLVTGEESPPFLRVLSHRLEKLLPHVESLDMRGVSHMPNEQDPETFNRAAWAFVERTEGVGSS